MLRGLKGWKCFVGDTLVVLGELPEKATTVATAGMAKVGRGVWIAAGTALAAAAVGTGVRIHQGKKKRKRAAAMENLFGGQELDDLLHPIEGLTALARQCRQAADETWDDVLAAVGGEPVRRIAFDS
jgi:hypothetical protein